MITLMLIMIYFGGIEAAYKLLRKTQGKIASGKDAIFWPMGLGIFIVHSMTNTPLEVDKKDD